MAAACRNESGLALTPGSGRRSKPGQMKSLVSVTTIQDRWASRPRSAFSAAGISIASAGLAGGVCVTGNDGHDFAAFNDCNAATIAQGRFLSPSSAPLVCSPAQR